MTVAFAGVFWGTMTVYALAVAGQIAGQVFRREALQRWASWAIAGGLALHTLLVAWRWAATGHIPTIGNFENALFGGWFVVAMALWAAWKERYALVAAATLPESFFVTSTGSTISAPAVDTSARSPRLSRYLAASSSETQRVASGHVISDQ